MNKLNVIKKINERLASYERRGLTDSASYQEILETIELLELPTTESKSGTMRISRAKTAIPEVSERDLTRLDEIGGLREEMKIAKEKGYKTTEEKHNYINNYGYTKSWMNENIDNLYADVIKGINPYAKELMGKIKGGLRAETYEKIKGMIALYENYDGTWEKVRRESQFYPFDE